MSNYNSLKTTIDANIKQNGRQEITGQILNSVLNQMVTTLGAGYQFAGVATLDPATDPGTPDAKVFYIANGKGTYTNFGGVEVTEDDVVVLYWDSSWHKVSTGIASNEKLTELATKEEHNESKGLLNFSSLSSAAKRNVANCIQAIRLYTSTSVKNVSIVVFQYVTSENKFWIQFYNNDTSLVLYTWRIDITSVPSSGIITYKTPVNAPVFGVITIDWSKFDGGFASNETPRLGVLCGELDSDECRVAKNLFANIPDQIANLESEVGNNAFANTRVGYLASNGSYSAGAALGIVTYPRKVTPGTKLHFKGGWQTNNDIGLLWGYSDSSLSNPVKLISAVSNIDTIVDIPTGVNYVMGWSVADRNPILEGGMLVRLTELENNSVGEKIVISNNLFNKDSVSHNYYVNYNSGNLSSLDGFDTSDYIPIEPSTTYSQRYSQQIAFYDEFKKYISGVASLTDGKFTTPAGAAYVRICNTAAQTNTQQINKGTTLYPYDNWAEGIKNLHIREENIISNVVVHRIVATRNQADFNSIRDIINSITDASASNRYEIIVPRGRWFECDIQGKEYVSIIGEDREETILYCDGTSTKLTPSGYAYADYSNQPLNTLSQSYKHCVFAKNDLDIRNLTIEVNDAKYDIHLDNTGYKTINVRNCHIKAGNNVNFCIGIGNHSGQTINIKNCIIERTGYVEGRRGIFAHNWNNQSAPSYIIVDSCLFKNCGFATIDELGSEQDDEWFIVNCYSDVQLPSIRWMVDKTSSGETYYIKPSTGQRETDPQLVPYCIKLNTLGSNVKSVQIDSEYFGVESRPNALDYMISNFDLIK